jgi:hypothetical protein
MERARSTALSATSLADSMARRLQVDGGGCQIRLNAHVCESAPGQRVRGQVRISPCGLAFQRRWVSAQQALKLFLAAPRARLVTCLLAAIRLLADARQTTNVRTEQYSSRSFWTGPTLNHVGRAHQVSSRSSLRAKPVGNHSYQLKVDYLSLAALIGASAETPRLSPEPPVLRCCPS